MLITKFNYEKNSQKLKNKNIELSEKLLNKMQYLGVSKLNIACVGNSISSGYSKCDKIIPLAMRSSLYELSNYDFFSFSRVRHNEDLNVFDWYNRNISHEEINKLLIDDIMVKKNSYPEQILEKDTLRLYEQFYKKQEIGFKDFNMLSNNIIIYNGFTGNFTDIMRKGNFTDKKQIFSSFRRDLEYVRVVLKQFYSDNPLVQVYICGLPNIMGTGIISLFDGKIKQLCKEFPNVIYLPGTIRNSLFYLEGQKEFDIHYSSPEYLCLWNNITTKIESSFISTKLKLELLNELRNCHLQNELIGTINQGDIEQVKKSISDIKEKYLEYFSKDEIEVSLLNIANYYNNNYLSSFACTPRNIVIDEIKKIYIKHK